jgi:endonuclease/exonuclease/phosphatase family metal-dependent hydrolase
MDEPGYPGQANLLNDSFDVMEILTGSFAAPRWRLWPSSSVRVVDWNIERGLKLAAVIEFLAAQDADLLVLQEVDLSARRTGGVNVAEEIAKKLGMDYVFGREFQELAEGSRAAPAFIGQATLSRWPLVNPRLIRFRLQTGFWHPRWYLPNIPLFQERLGGRIALVTQVQVPGKSLSVYNLHLESRGNDQLRMSQLEEVLMDAMQLPPQAVVLVSGDMNFNISDPVPAGAVLRAGFSDAVGLRGVPTTPRRGLFDPAEPIDHALVRGPVRAEGGRVNNRVRASDHYPLSFTLTLP